MATQKKSAKKKPAASQPKAWGMDMPWAALRDADHERELREVYSDQVQKIRDLEKQINFEKSKLPKLQAQITAHVAKLRALKFKPEPICEYDEAVKSQISRMRYQTSTYKAGKHVKMPTGAVKWEELRKNGATDAQIRKNLLALECYYGGDAYVAKNREQLSIRQYRYDGPNREAVKGNDKVVAEVRRIMQIPQPVKAPPANAGGSRKRSKKKAPPQKSNAAAKSDAGTRNAATRRAKTKPRSSAKPTAKKSNTPPAHAGGSLLVNSQGSVTEALAAIEANPDGYAALKKRLRKKPTSAQVLKHLRGPEAPGADADGSPGGAAEKIVAHATGKLPDASKNGVRHYDGPDEEFEFDDLAAQTIAAGDVELPTTAASNGRSAGPKTFEVKAPNPGRQNARRKPAVAK